MNTICLLVLIVAFAGNAGTQQFHPVVAVAPNPYVGGVANPISVDLGGFDSHGDAVDVNFEGPTFLHVYITVDGAGNGIASYPEGIAFPAGEYTVNATQHVHHKTLNAPQVILEVTP